LLIAIKMLPNIDDKYLEFNFNHMQPENLAKIKKLEKQLTAAIILLFVLIIGFLAIYDLKPGQEALATTGNYSKSLGEELTVDNWNNLQADFVDASGDTIGGNLIVNGRIGLNNSSPSHELTVKDSTEGSGIYIWGDNKNAELALGDGTSHWAIYSDETNTDDLKFWRGSNKMVITDDGKVGIGADSPNTVLHAREPINTDVETLRIDSKGDPGAVQGKTYLGLSHFITGTYPSARIGVEEDGNASYDASLVFQTRSSASDVVPTTKMVINKAGNVGIGVTNPQAKLDVAGDIAVNGRSYIKIGSVNNGAGDSFEESGKDILDLKLIVGNLENAKKCLVFVVASQPEHNYDYKAFCRVDSNGFIDAALKQDTVGPYDGNVTCGYICTATADQNVVYY